MDFSLDQFWPYLHLPHDNIHRLDFTVYLLLAAGHFGVGIIPHLLADLASFQVAGDCCGWHF